MKESSLREQPSPAASCTIYYCSGSFHRSSFIVLFLALNYVAPEEMKHIVIVFIYLFVLSGHKMLGYTYHGMGAC